ncbi:MAG: hypothetical protein K2L84_06390 [Muribaculaceae bacterium]|nr:hypothetical protein [Muribaculaceae bacterium]
MNTIIKLFLFAIALLGSTPAFAYTYGANVKASTGPTGNGLVYVSKSTTNSPSYQEAPAAVSQSGRTQTPPTYTFHLYAQPSQGNTFYGWKRDGYIVNNELHFTRNIPGSRSTETINEYTGEFGPEGMLKVVPTTLGTVSIDKPDNVLGDVVTVSTRAQLNDCEAVNIGAVNVVNRNFIFRHWKDGDGNIVSYEKTFSLTVEKAMTLTPVYDNPSTVTKSSGYYRVMSGFSAGLRIAGEVSINYNENTQLWGDINYVRNPEGTGYGYDKSKVNNIYNDPALIIYMTGTLQSSGAASYSANKDVMTNIVLSGQGKKTTDFINKTINLKWSYNTGYHVIYNSAGALKFTEDASKNPGGDILYVGAADGSVQTNLHFEPITDEYADIWWFGAFPSEQMYYDGGYWTSMYTAFPYRCYEPDGVEAYIISDYTFDGQSNTAVLKRIENGIVPAYTPVLLKCPKVIDTTDYFAKRIMPEPANRLIPLEPNDASIDNTVAEGNLLKGEFQLNKSIPEKTSTPAELGHVMFNAETMRIFSANANNEVGFYVLPANADGTAQELAANKAYLDLTAIPAEARTSSFRIVSEDEAAGIENIIVKPAPAVREGIYDLYGRRVEHMIPGNIYIVNGVKTLAR